MKLYIGTLALAFLAAINTEARPQSFAVPQYRRDRSHFAPLILGGSEVPVGESQYVSGMRMNAETEDSFCGGSLIHPQWVLTAAHCKEYIQYVSVGTHYLNGTTDGTVVKVVKKIQHPKYSTEGNSNDLLLLKLEKRVKYTPVALAKADGSDEKIGTVATTKGWGTTTEGGAQSDVLLAVDVNILENDVCNKTLGGIDQTMICAGGEQNKDSCQGDSGGPLITKKGAKDVLVGVVSWGNGCGRPGYPGVYARVSVNRKFIDSYVKSVKWV